MTALSYLIIALGYLAFFLIIVGIVYRIWSWKHLPRGFSWGLFPKPTKWTTTSLLWRSFAWPTLFEVNKSLWVGAALFHLGILALFVGHTGVFVNTLGFMESIGIPAGTSYTIGVVAGIIVGIALIFYSSRRVFITEARDISSFADHFWLWFLLAVIVTGVYARTFYGVSSDTVREFATSLATFRIVMPPQNLWFLIHTLLAELFLIYAVAGKPIHSIGQLFTQYIIVEKE